MRTRHHSVKLMLLMTSLATVIGCLPDYEISFGPGGENRPGTSPAPVVDTLPLTYLTVGLICPYCGRDTVYEVPDDAPAGLWQRETLVSVRIGIGDHDAVAPWVNGFRLTSNGFAFIYGGHLDWAITSSDPDVAMFSQSRGDGNVLSRNGWVTGVSPGERRSRSGPTI